MAAALVLVTGCGGGGDSASASVGATCTNEGAQTGIENGTLICTSANGALTWQRLAPGSEGTGSSGGTPGTGGPVDTEGSSGNATMIRVGAPCAEDGVIGFSGGGLVICDGGTGRYAMEADLPPAPAGGYTERPSWYPTLADMFGPTVSDCPNGSVVFDHPVVPPDQIAPSMPHGMMILDHVTPIDHMYIGIAPLLKDPAARTDADSVPVTAPADGTIVEVGGLGSPTSHRVVISHGCDLVSVYMVVNALTGPLAQYAAEVDAGGQVKVSIPVRAGEEFGRQRDNPLDFNVFDGTSWSTGLANPYSYAFGEAWKPYTVDPFPHMTDEARAPLEASVQRLVEPRWGPIAHDVIGAASGSWFLDGTIGYNGQLVDTVRSATSDIGGGPIAGKSTYAYGHLSLSPHPVDPTKWIFSIGAWPDQSGDPRQLMIDLSDGQPTPDRLTAASGVVVYRLVEPIRHQPSGYVQASSMTPDGIGYTLDVGPQSGWVVVQVLDDRTIAIETSTDVGTPPTGFGPARLTYHR